MKAPVGSVCFPVRRGLAWTYKGVKEYEIDRKCDVTKVCFEILCGCQNVISRLFLGVST